MIIERIEKLEQENIETTNVLYEILTKIELMESNKKMTDFNYKEYSLSQLENWMHDAMSAGEASPQEIYDTIHKVVSENYYIYKQKTSEAYELLALLNGNGKGHIKAFDDCVDKVLSCDRGDPSPECEGAWNDFWEEHQEDKVIRWQLPIEMHPSGEYFITFPDDLLEAANLQEGDKVEWIDQGNRSFILKKCNDTLK